MAGFENANAGLEEEVDEGLNDGFLGDDERGSRDEISISIPKLPNLTYEDQRRKFDSMSNLPFYTPTVRSQTFTTKIEGAHPSNSSECDRLAEEHKAQIYTHFQRKVGNRGLLSVKTVAFPGCVCLITIVTYSNQRIPQMTIAELFRCLPAKLQDQHIVIVGDECVVEVKDGQEISRAKKKRDDKLAEVQYLKPPCMSGEKGVSTSVVLKTPEQDEWADCRCITEMDNRLKMDCPLSTSGSLEFTFKVDKPLVGSIFITDQNRKVPLVTPAALIGVFPPKVSQELNGFFDKIAASISNSASDDLSRTQGWKHVIKPLLVEMDFILSVSPEEAKNCEPDFANRTLEFLLKHGLYNCNEFLCKHIGITGPGAAVRNTSGSGLLSKKPKQRSMDSHKRPFSKIADCSSSPIGSAHPAFVC